MELCFFKNMHSRSTKFGTRNTVPAGHGWRRSLVFTLLAGIMAFAGLMALVPAAPADTAAGKVLEELRYQVDVWVCKDALRVKVQFREVGPGRYRADLDSHSQGLLAILTGGWEGGLSTEMEYSQGKLRPLVYREISTKQGKKRVMEYRFDYAQKKVELFKTDDQGKMTKRWETSLNGPMYDPLTFFYNRRLTGAGANEKGGESVKFQSIPYPKPDDITLRVGDQTPEGRKIMVDLGNRMFKEEHSQVYAILDSDGVPTKAWTQVMKFGNVDIKLLPGGKRLNKAEVAKEPGQSQACQGSD